MKRAALFRSAALFAGTIAMASPALAQGVFPPAGNERAAASASTSGAASPFPPVGGSTQPSPFPAPGGSTAFPTRGAAPVSGTPGGGGFGAPPQGQPSADCMQEFAPLRAEAERRAGLVKKAGERRTGPAEACKALSHFAEAEAKMVRFMTTKAKSCGIPSEIAGQVKKNHAGTLQIKNKVCAAAAGGGGPAGPAGPSLSEALGGSALPEAPVKRSGGSTFDTLSGNVLAR